MPARSMMFPVLCNPRGKCQHGAWGAVEAAGVSSCSWLLPSLYKRAAHPELRHCFDLADVKIQGSIFWLFRCRKIVICAKTGILEKAALC